MKTHFDTTLRDIAEIINQVAQASKYPIQRLWTSIAFYDMSDVEIGQYLALQPIMASAFNELNGYNCEFGQNCVFVPWKNDFYMIAPGTDREDIGDLCGEIVHRNGHRKLIYCSPDC